MNSLNQRFKLFGPSLGARLDRSDSRIRVLIVGGASRPPALINHKQHVARTYSDSEIQAHNFDKAIIAIRAWVRESQGKS